MNLTKEEIFEFLEEKHLRYNCYEFIEDDPISIPHLFSKKEDIEIAGFLSATIAWGKRKMIIDNATKMMTLMDNAPHDFVLNAETKDLDRLASFKHRTFNGKDFGYFVQSLQNIYVNHGGLENVFAKYPTNQKANIAHFKQVFFDIPHPTRTTKHVSDPAKNSAAKRINMFLRWMVRKDQKGVDFGIWNSIDTKNLMLPLDVHTSNVARKLGLLKRKQDDWKAVEEVTNQLKTYDPNDPIKYDFSLFGLGVNEKF